MLYFNWYKKIKNRKCHMIQVYNNQEKIASKIVEILKFSNPTIRKTQLNIIPYIILGMLSSESSVAGDIAKVLKDDFSLVQYDSITRRIRRLYNNKHFDPNIFYENIIKYVLSTFKLKHSDNTIHIIFDHMYSHDNYTVLLFSMKIGNQGIPLLFKCFKSSKEPEAFTDETICDCIQQVSSYFNNTNYKLIFLADRWFNSEAILSTINNLHHTFCIRLKGNIKVKVFDNKEGHYILKNTGDLTGKKTRGKYYQNVYLYENSTFKTNISISKSNNIDEPWIVVTNGEPNRAIRRYSYRFGSIECIFKNQKSNGFYIEKISNSSLKSFTSMYSLVCFCVLFLTIIGCDYTKNKKCYKKVKIETHKTYKGIKRRIVSLFNVGLILFKRAFNSHVYIRIPFTMILYDI